MIIEYHRPKALTEALLLLGRKDIKSYPLGGGTVLNRGVEEEIAVVDLQALGLQKALIEGNAINIGATTTLQELMELDGLSIEIIKVIELEATFNIRQMATIAGRIVTADGRSPLTTTLLALDASIELQELDKKPMITKIGDWLPLRNPSITGKLITMVSIPHSIKIAYEYIARTPADLPIVCSAVAQWDSGRTRVALGGWGSYPILVFDGPTSDGIEFAAGNAYSSANDEWASAEYRQEMAAVLSMRCLKRLSSF